MSDLRDRLQQIRDQHGRLTPALVVDAARPKDAPLHDRFEWDNRVAGEAYRRQQAAELIRSVRIEYVTPTGGQSTVRGFHAVRGPQGYSYEPAETVAEDPLIREIVLREMEREFRQMIERYDRFTEFVKMVDEYRARRDAQAGTD